MKRAGWVLGLAAALFSAAGCDRATVPGTERPMSGVLAYAEGGGLSDQSGMAIGLVGSVEAPDTVVAGETFTVAVTTVGDGCWARGEMKAEDGPGAVELRPYDVFSGAEACLMIAQFFRHEAELRFEEPGDRTLRVLGREVKDGDLLGGEEIVLEHRVTVR